MSQFEPCDLNNLRRQSGLTASPEAVSIDRLLDEWHLHTPDSDRNPGSRLEQAAAKAADLIMTNSDFSYGAKRERLSAIFRNAADDGQQSLEKLIQAINRELGLRNSSLHLSGTYTRTSKVVDEAARPQTGIDILILPALYKYTYAGAEFRLKDTKSGSEEDRLTISGRQLERVHIDHNDGNMFRLTVQ